MYGARAAPCPVCSVSQELSVTKPTQRGRFEAHHPTCCWGGSSAYWACASHSIWTSDGLAIPHHAQARRKRGHRQQHGIQLRQRRQASSRGGLWSRACGRLHHQRPRRGSVRVVTSHSAAGPPCCARTHAHVPGNVRSGPRQTGVGIGDGSRSSAAAAPPR